MLAPLSETSGGVGSIRPSGSRCRGFWRDPCSVSRVASLLNFSALGTLEANPRVYATSAGIGFLHPLSPCTHVWFWCKPRFAARRGYTHIISLFLHRAPSYDPAYQQQSIPLAAALIGACDALSAYTRLPLAAAAPAASVKWHAGITCKDRLNIKLVLKLSSHLLFMLVCFLYKKKWKYTPACCEIEDFVETHHCKLCVILRSSVLRLVCPH